MALSNPRLLNLLIFAGCSLLLAIGLYLEHVQGLEPCPLCIVQRIAFAGVGLLALLAALHGPQRQGRRIYAGLSLLCALGGAATAGRQLWLQSLPPDQLPACLPSLDYMLEALPLQQIVGLVLHGTADCTEISWMLLGLGIPEWSLLGFIALIGLQGYQLLRRR